MKRKKLIYLTGFLFMILLLSACTEEASSTDGEQEERMTPVEVAEVTKGDLQMERKIIGTANASSMTEIIPKVSGELMELLMEKGDVIEKGQVIGHIDAASIQDNLTLQQLSVESAQKQLESARVQKTLAEQGVANAKEQLKQAKTNSEMDSENDKENANINVENAKIQLEQAETTLERMQVLYEEGAVSLNDLEQAEMAEQQARNAYEQAKNTSESTKDQLEAGDITSESSVNQAEIAVENAEQQLESAKIQVETAELQVEQAQVQLQQLQDQVDDTAIKANVSGEVVALNVDVGDMVSNQQSMGTIISLDTLTITANVNPEELSLFEKGQTIPVYVKALDLTEEATITYISPMINDSGLYSVEAELLNEDKAIKAGMMAEFQLPSTLVEDALLVPTEALVEEGDQTYVYVVEEDRAYLREVTTLNSQSDVTAIRGDIQVGDQVVTSGQITLSDESKITIIEEAAN